MDLPLFRYGKLYGGPPYLVNEVDPIIVISLATYIVARSRSTREVYHFPIRNLHVEPIHNIGYALEKINYHISKGESVYVHCLGGCGRTGTVISAYLIIFHKYSYRDAILEFLRQRGCTVESYEQELFLNILSRLTQVIRVEYRIISLVKESNSLDDFMRNAEKIIDF